MSETENLVPALGMERLIIQGFLDPHWEPCIEEYREHFWALNAIVRDLAVPLEGSLFNKHLITEILDTPDPDFLAKRRNFALFALAGRSMIEIGFNAGHSCLLALTMNKALRYTGVDMGYHAYVQPCARYLKSVFGDRFELYIGDSRDVLPVLREHGASPFDLYHLDGGHGFNTAHADLCNMLSLAKAPAILLFDDTGHPDLDSLCDYYVMVGKLSRVQMNRLWSDTINHRLFRTIPT